jgi:hypothetical protein
MHSCIQYRVLRYLYAPGAYHIKFLKSQSQDVKYLTTTLALVVVVVKLFFRRWWKSLCVVCKLLLGWRWWLDRRQEIVFYQVMMPQTIIFYYLRNIWRHKVVFNMYEEFIANTMEILFTVRIESFSHRQSFLIYVVHVAFGIHTCMNASCARRSQSYDHELTTQPQITYVVCLWNQKCFLRHWKILCVDFYNASAVHSRRIGYWWQQKLNAKINLAIHQLQGFTIFFCGPPALKWAEEVLRWFTHIIDI